MRALNMQAFLRAIEMCCSEKVDFILIAGDLFNTALPAIEMLHSVTLELRKLKELEIPVYVIPGSHDFSASGKTMIDVLEGAGMLVNVCRGEVVGQKLRLRFTVDARTSAKITGMLGKKGMLDRVYYEDLDREYLEKEGGYKIFLFHTALTELKPRGLEQMDTYPVSLLPKGFEYYAGGHVHYPLEYSAEGYKKVAQPGALFPNNFKELEDLGSGGFYIITDGSVEWKEVKVKHRVVIAIDCEGKSAEEVYDAAVEALDQKEVADAVVLLRFTGMIKGGKVSDVPFQAIFDRIYGRKAYLVLKNAAALKSEEFEEINVQQNSVDEIEDALIREHVQQVSVGLSVEEEVLLTKELMGALSTEKKEGETVRDFEERVKREGMSVLKFG